MEAAVKDINLELIEACRNHDHTAQVRIYDLYYKAMFNTSYRIVRNIAEAEDIMQDSFIEAFRKIREFRGEGSFGSWLKRIVVNRSIDAIRKKTEWISLDDLGKEMEDPGVKENEYSENLFCRLEEIRNAFEKLPDQYRIIISLHLFEGYDHEEMSEMLNLNPVNIRVRYMRAKQKLLQIIMKTREVKPELENIQLKPK